MNTEFDSTYPPPVGTGCFFCRNDHNHYCPATGYWNDVESCRPCAEAQLCEARQAHERRRSGIEPLVDGIVPPVKTLPLSDKDRKPIKDVEWMSEWRKSLELSAKNLSHMKRERPEVPFRFNFTREKSCGDDQMRAWRRHLAIVSEKYN